MRYLRHGVVTIPNTICQLRTKYISRVTFCIYLLNTNSGHTRINIHLRNRPLLPFTMTIMSKLKPVPFKNITFYVTKISICTCIKIWLLTNLLEPNNKDIYLSGHERPVLLSSQSRLSLLFSLYHAWFIILIAQIILKSHMNQ